ncbi:hypothetical protein [Paraburkholderia sp. C35]|uniref:hypothetical protein n=1 Tax=Paraburkholderia sp. C35 TaxID=2126993 RepID=UPI0013A56BDD|nr:hypothetical protein [Paraburkholderia sp. C35]
MNQSEISKAVVEALARANGAGCNVRARYTECALTVGVPGMGGFEWIDATPEQVLRLADDPTAIYAELVGLTKAEYLEWFESQGLVYCSGTTVKGQRCKNPIVRPQALSAQDWKKLREDGGYCHAHGG